MQEVKKAIWTILEDNQLDEPTLRPETVIGLLEICLKVSYCQSRGKVYELEDGLLMGSPVSDVVANIYMSAWEEIPLASFKGRKPKLCWWFGRYFF